MPIERARLLELAIENLINKKKQIDIEIAEITGELEGGRPKKATVAAPAGKLTSGARKRSRFSKEERERRSARMKAYWENWRKQKKGQK
jgi:hypothetical protein